MASPMSTEGNFKVADIQSKTITVLVKATAIQMIEQIGNSVTIIPVARMTSLAEQ